ncbi:MAG: sigma-70 family RNA polymerase sigma factor [Candidatus Hydrogenedentes bacterium]|nr:sigma-70 family RNA polymerase sigma factor [Candidatus Hydrogenedentota bacterium]
MALPDEIALNLWMDRRDPNAFMAIVQRYGRMVYGASYRILGNVSDAEDVTQECFQALAEGKAPDRTLAIGPWLHAVATNRSLNRVRSESRRRRRETEYAGERNAEAVIQWDDVYDMIDAAIAELPEKHRAPLVAHFLCGQSHMEIAKRLGIPRRTVSNRIGSAVEELRTLLKRRGVVVGAAGLLGLLEANGVSALPLPQSLEVALGKLALLHAVKAGSAGFTSSSPVWIPAVLGTNMKLTLAGLLAILLLGGWPWMRAGWDSIPVPSEPAANSARDPSVRPPQGPVEAVAEPRTRDLSTPVAALPAGIGNAGSPLVSGQVYDSKTFEGIEGARVSARPLSGQSTTGLSNITARNGRYEIADLEPGAYELYLGKGIVNGEIQFGWPWFEKQNVMLNSNSVLADFPMDRGVQVHGTVVDDRGRAAGNAMVYAVTEENRGQVHSADTTGSFRLFKFAPDNKVFIYAKNSAWASPMHGPISLDRESTLELQLELKHRTAAVSGVVIDEAGRAVPGVEVSAMGPAPFRYLGLSPLTDARGQFSLEALAPGSYRLNTGNRDSAPGVLLAAGEHRHHVVLVHDAPGEALGISGSVIDQAAHPVPGARVTAQGVHMTSGFTGPQGEFHLEDVPPGIYTLLANKGADLFQRIEGIHAGSGHVRIVLEHQHVAELQGRVLSAETGEAIVTYQLTWSIGSDLSAPFVWDSPRTRWIHDSQGLFKLDSVHSGQILIHARAAGHVEGSERVTLSPSGPGTPEVRLLLSPGAVVEGVVRDAAGAPVPGALLRAGAPDGIEGRGMEYTGVQSGPGGTFRFDTLPASEQVIWVEHPAYARADVRVTPNRLQQEYVEIVVDEGGRLYGTVSVDSFPLNENLLGYAEHAVIEAIHLDENLPARKRVLAGPDGAFELRGLQPGETEIRVQLLRPIGRKHAVLTASRAVQIDGGAALRAGFDLREGEAEVEGNIVSGELPVYDVVISAEWLADLDTHVRVSVEPDGLGYYRLEGLPIALKRLHLRSRGDGRSYSVPVALQAGSILRKDVDLDG